MISSRNLLHYIQQNRAALEGAPLGIHAVVDNSALAVPGRSANPVRPGAIFCLKRSGDPAARTPNRLWPYFLVYVRDDGAVRYTFRQARQCLALFRALAADQSQASTALENAFDRETDHGRRMENYDKLLDAALRNIAGTFRSAQLRALARERGAVLAKQSVLPEGAEPFELITWLVITDKNSTTENGTPGDA